MKKNIKINIGGLKRKLNKVSVFIISKNLVFIIFSWFIILAIFGILIYLGYTSKLKEGESRVYISKFLFRGGGNIDYIKEKWMKMKEEFEKSDSLEYKNIFK